MKKLTALLLATLLILLAADALAVPPSMPYPPELSLRWQLLTEPQKELFDLLYEALRRGDAEIVFSKRVMYDDIDPVMSVLQLDCPELCAAGYDYSIGYYRNEPDTAIGICFTYTLPVETQDQLLHRAALLLDGLPADPAARVKAIHDTVCALTEYADTAHAHNAYGALMDGRSVCDGSTKALILLLRLSGIPCSMVTGTADNGSGTENHSWCILQLEGAYTQIDIVWNDQAAGIRYDCFLVSDETIATDHARDADSLRLPACPEASTQGE